MSLAGEVAIITVGNAALSSALDGDSYLIAAALVIDDAYNEVSGGHTSCKRT